MILIEPTIHTQFGRRLRLRALSGFLESAAAAAKLRGEVSVLLTGDAHIRRLNRQFRRKDKPTDVLSFPAPDIPGGQGLAGDLAISVETAASQAKDLGHSLSVELQVLILHGLLHLAGYDHEQDSGQMARREATLRRRLGLSHGLIERSHAVLPTRREADRP
jgi:probable rRNA maturation factor